MPPQFPEYFILLVGADQTPRRIDVRFLESALKSAEAVAHRISQFFLVPGFRFRVAVDDWEILFHRKVIFVCLFAPGLCGPVLQDKSEAKRSAVQLHFFSFFSDSGYAGRERG